MTRTLAIAAAVLASHGCKGVECGEGTLEKNGTCVGADDTVGNAKCGTCFYWQNLNQGESLKPDHIEKISDALGELIWLVLSIIGFGLVLVTKLGAPAAEASAS